MKRALISVTDKTGAVQFAQALVQKGFEILSTGGTAKAIRDAGFPVTDVSEVTGFPEMLDGRIKTLHPKVHGAILADLRLDAHESALKDANIQPIEIVAVNLYAFEKTVSQPHTFEEAVEAVDIGGPTMIRAAAKNHANVTVVVDPADYAKVLHGLDTNTLAELRLELAAKAFRHTAFYDSAIARYFTKAAGLHHLEQETYTLGLRRTLPFRYGENPHQNGALFEDPLARSFESVGIVQARQLWGKELSYNNLMDADAAFELVADLGPNACAIIKHGNPCGAAESTDLAASFREARKSDPISAFGGIAAFQSPVNRIAAEAMTEKGNFLEVVIAPSFDPDAVEIFQNRSGWGQDVRLLQAEVPRSNHYLTVRTLRGGAIVQESDEDPVKPWTVASDREPTPEEWEGLRFAWKVIPHIKSNAIAVCKAGRLLGVGAGQMNRVQSVRLSLEQAGEEAKGAVLASDAFFPFPDNVHTAAAAGITAIIQPGGSKKDQDSVKAANDYGIAMIFTGTRHFRH